MTVASVRPRRRLIERPVLFQLAVLELTTITALMIGLILLDNASIYAFSVVKLAGACALGMFAVYGVIEAFAAMKMRPLPPRPGTAMPPTTAIIPAYLPNEAPIIVDTVMHHLSTGPSDLQVIVAYNTPRPMEEEEVLRRLALEHPRLTVLRVANSRTKAANVNAALDLARGEIIGVFDADHLPGPDSFERAWCWLADGADVVQGRCVVRALEGTRQSFLNMAVTAEFEQMYSVGHPGRTRVMGIGLFGGSNGFWRAESLRAIRLDPTALTEDIDASVRLLKAGGRIATDPNIVSGELAPPSLTALCGQRLRWAQGWFQVGRRHLLGIVFNRNIPLRNRFGVFWLWGWGTILPWIGALSLPLTFHGWIHKDTSPFSGLIRDILMFGTLSFLVHVGVAYRRAVTGKKRRMAFATYLASNLVFYAYLRVALSRLGHIHEFAGQKAWLVTPRTTSEGAAPEPGVPERWSLAPVARLRTALAAVDASASTDGQGVDLVERDGRFLGRRFIRPALWGLLATTAITWGASQPTSPFALKLSGAWYFGIPSITTPPGQHALWSLVATVGGVFLLIRVWLQITRLARPAGGRAMPVAVLGGIAALWMLPLLVGPPLLGQDVYSYAAQGQMVAHGINPYLHGPDALGPNSPYYPLVDQHWGATPATYGPVFLQLNAAINNIVGHNVLAAVEGLRLLALAGVALLAAFLPMIARSLRRDPAVTFALAILNPITLLYLVSGAHDDALMLGLLAAGIALALRDRPMWGVVLCAAAGGVKAPALLGVLFVGWNWLGPKVDWRERIRPTITACLVAGSLLGAVTAATGLGWGWIHDIGSPSGVRSLLAPTTAVGRFIEWIGHELHLPFGADWTVTGVRVLGVLVALGIATRLLITSQRTGWVRSLGITLMVVVALGPFIWPSYLAWSLIVLAPVAAGRTRVLVVAVAIVGTFMNFPGGRLMLDELVHAPGWAVLSVLALLGVALGPRLMTPLRRITTAVGSTEGLARVSASAD